MRKRNISPIISKWDRGS